jgi:adenine phosphoribosyltransferase
MLIAQELNVGSCPSENPTSCHDTISASYELEYGTDTLEIHTDAIRKGDRVLIHDDVLNWRNRASSMRIGGGIAVKSSS